MTLYEFMKAEKLNDAEMAARLGCSRGAVLKWRYGERMPRPNQLSKIHEATGGQVTANDFMLSQADGVAA